jgi:hypothetical protein
MTTEDLYDHYLKYRKPVRITVSLDLTSNEAQEPTISLQALVDLGDDGVFTGESMHNLDKIANPVDAWDTPLTDAIFDVLDTAIGDHEPMSHDDATGQTIMVEIEGLVNVRLPDGYRHVKYGRIKEGDLLYDDCSDEWDVVSPEGVGGLVEGYYAVARKRRDGPGSAPTP